MAEIPMLQAYASFMDAILFIKHKMHTAPNASAMKKIISKKLGLSPNASYNSYAYELGVTLINNGYEKKIYSFLTKMKMTADNDKRVLKSK